MRQRWLILIVCLLVAAAACTSRPIDPFAEATSTAAAGQATLQLSPTPVPQTPTPGPLTLVYWEEDSDDGDVLLDELAAEFMQANPDIVVQRAHYRYEELSLLFRSAALSGAAPDLVRAPGEFTEPFVTLDIIEPAVQLFDAQMLDRFVEGARETSTIDGVVWGLPENYGDHLMLIYNTDLVSEVPDNTDAWIAQMKALTDPATGQYGLVYNLDEPYWIVPWISGFGGWPIDDKGQPMLDTEAVVNALRFVQDLKLVHRVTPETADYEAAFDVFRQGKAAYIVDGRWNLDRYTGTGLNVGVTALPVVSATGWRPEPMAAAKNWFISKQTTGAQRDAALRFATFITSAQAQEAWLTRMGRLPADRETLALARNNADPLIAGAAQQLLYARGLPPAQTMPCIWAAMSPALKDLMAGGTSPEATAKTMQADAMRCVQELNALATPELPVN